MADPFAVQDGSGEWFEVKARASVDLNGLVLAEALGQSTLSSSTCLPLAAGSFGLFARSSNAAINGGLPNVAAQFDFGLRNTGDTIAIKSGGNVIDEVTYGEVTAGQSLQLSLSAQDAVANDNGSNWCASVTMYGAGDWGTPGAANDPCP
jgi:hypothetical protein